MPKKESFESLFETLCNRFGKPYKADLADIYFRRLKDIPDEAMKNITESIIDNEKYFPTPGTIKNAWYIWLQQRPYKRQYSAKTECQSCGGQGYYIYRKYDHDIGKWYEHLARCAYCQNWKGVLGDAVPAAKRVDLESEGCIIVEFWKDQDIPKLQSLEKCIDMTTKKMPYSGSITEPQRERRIAELRKQAEQIQDDIPF